MREAKAGIIHVRFFHGFLLFGVVWFHNRVPLL